VPIEPDVAGAASLDGQRLLAKSDPRGARLIWFDLIRPENRDVWPALARAHRARTRIELFEWLVDALPLNPAGGPADLTAMELWSLRNHPVELPKAAPVRRVYARRFRAVGGRRA
jgi:hypothetical protein